MAYKKVKRVVTIEFVKEKRGKGYEVLITPEIIVARFKDTLEWSIQGLPPGLSRRIGVGNFVRLDASARVTHGKKGLAADKSKHVPAAPARRKSVGGGAATLTVELGTTDPGVYKYDLLSDGKTLIDPELEIRGPRA